MSKKNSAIVLLLICFCSFSFAKERMNISTYALLQSQKSGGGAGFSFPVFNKNDFFIRKEIIEEDETRYLISLDNEEEFDKAIVEYTKRDRRFGGINYEDKAN